MKHYAKAAVALSCLLASAVAVAVPSTPKAEFNSYTFDTLDTDDGLANHNVANGGVPFTDAITFELAAGSTYDLGFAATSNGRSPSQKFSSFNFVLYSGALTTQAALQGATQTAGSTVGSFASELSATGLAAGWYTLAVSGVGASNGAQYTLGVSSLTAAVPEPETYAMLLAGLGLMGFVARRRSKD